ncbi:MAG: Uncharacterised protein [Hyphomonas sp. TMED17]|nr:MAG: Uncharacterised protein [Hyphomonas sp. TMED17]
MICWASSRRPRAELSIASFDVVSPIHKISCWPALRPSTSRKRPSRAIKVRENGRPVLTSSVSLIRRRVSIPASSRASRSARPSSNRSPDVPESLWRLSFNRSARAMLEPNTCGETRYSPSALKSSARQTSTTPGYAPTIDCISDRPFSTLSARSYCRRASKRPFSDMRRPQSAQASASASAPVATRNDISSEPIGIGLSGRGREPRHDAINKDKKYSAKTLRIASPGIRCHALRHQSRSGRLCHQLVSIMFGLEGPFG